MKPTIPTKPNWPIGKVLTLKYSLDSDIKKGRKAELINLRRDKNHASGIRAHVHILGPWRRLTGVDRKLDLGHFVEFQG